MAKELENCPLCGVAVDSGPTGGIYIHHPIDPKTPWACNMANADIRVADWQTRPGEDAARLKQFEEDCKVVKTAGLAVDARIRVIEHLRRAWEERHDEN